MNITENWNELNNQNDNDLASFLQSARLSKLETKSPLDKIKKNLLLNMVWAVLICVAFIFIIIHFHIWQVQVAIGLVLLFSLWALFTAFIVYKKINTSVSTAPLLDELKRHHQTISSWMDSQQRIALFIYPISAAGGFMLGGVEGSGKSVEAFMGKPVIIISLIITLAILVPTCYYLAKWMFSAAFGKHLDALKANIEALEDEK
jgi:hypothetical protein